MLNNIIILFHLAKNVYLILLLLINVVIILPSINKYIYTYGLSFSEFFNTYILTFDSEQLNTFAIYFFNTKIVAFSLIVINGFFNGNSSGKAGQLINPTTTLRISLSLFSEISSKIIGDIGGNDISGELGGDGC